MSVSPTGPTDAHHCQPSGGRIAVAAVGLSLVALLAVATPFLVVPALTRIPWMATPQHICEMAVARLPRHPVGKRSGSPRLVDLGSGDGRFVIEAARRGYLADGIELNPVLVALSYWNAARAGVLGKVRFRMTDLWRIQLDQYDAVTCFGIAPLMARLDEKLRLEARHDTVVVCYRFPLSRPEDWRHGELFIYKIKRGE